jgi:gamma-glutamyltranspeptidase/glutathione hydrolase
MSTLGGAAVGVPGSISAIFEIHSKFGTLPIEDLFQPAIKLAQEGFIVTENQSSSLSGKLDDFIKINGKNSLYSKRYYKGDTIKNTKFAETLSKISKNGSKAFYEGEIAEMIIDEVIESGGIMTIEDLKNYKSIWRDPLIFKYKDLDIISMSLPSSGGILLGQMLKAIEDYDISRYGHNSLNAIQLMVEVERRAYADRSHFMGDPDFMNLPVYELIDKKYIQDRMNNFSWDIATPSSEIKHGNVIINESDETTHYSIIDKYGNAVSVTTTLNNSYGSKVYVEDGGFFLNNEMDDFSSKPGHPNFYGLIGSEANSIQPKKRMLSSMTPTIVLKDNKPSLIVGTPGGATIITSVFQTILNVYEFNMNVQDAVNAPRFHHQWLPDVIIIEKRGLWDYGNGSDNRIDSLLRNKNYNVISLPFESEMSGMSPRSSIGAVDAIFIDENGKVSGGADYRGDDFAATLK